MQASTRINRDVIAGIAMMALTAGLAQAHEGHEEEGGHLIPHEIGGLDLDGGITWYLQGSDGAANDSAALTYTLDIGLESEIREGGRVVVALEAGEGEGIDKELRSLSTANYDAFYTDLTTSIDGSTNIVAPSISQAYYEGEYLNGSMVVTAGKLDIHSMYDDNAYANDETDQFMSAIFTRSPGTSYGEMDYYYAPGVALNYGFNDEVDVTLIAANGNNAGFDNLLENSYLVGQLNFRPKLMGWQGNYRLYAFQDGRESYDGFGSPVTVFHDATTNEIVSNTAWGLSFDQAVANGVGVFARYSSQDDNIVENAIDSAWSAGMLLQGARWSRVGDTFGIAYGSVNLNQNTKALNAFKTDSGISNADDESHLEAFYKVGFSDHFTVTADLQVIQNNGGDAAADTVSVAGIRGQLNF